MVLNVDFNMRDALNRVPAVVGPSVGRLDLGQIVLAEDGEGNRCKAEVVEVSTDRGAAYLRLIPGTSEPSAHVEWVANEVQEELEEDHSLHSAF